MVNGFKAGPAILQSVPWDPNRLPEEQNYWLLIMCPHFAFLSPRLYENPSASITINASQDLLAGKNFIKQYSVVCDEIQLHTKFQVCIWKNVGDASFF